MEGRKKQKITQQGFEQVELGLRIYVMSRFNLVAGEENEERWYRLEGLCWLLRIRGLDNHVAEDFAFLQYMECKTPLDNAHVLLTCICGRQSRDDEEDNAV